MELSCPKCNTRFTIADGALGEAGRKVRCSVCAHVWHAAPAEAPLLLEPEGDAGLPPPLPGAAAGMPAAGQPYADSPAGPTPDPANPLPAEDLPVLDRRSIPTWNPPQTAARAKPQGRWAPLAVGLVLLAGVALTYGLRDAIVAAVPAAKPIFQLAELPLEQAGDGLAFVNLASGPVTENGQPMLRVTGFVQNTVDFRREIPWVLIELRDGQGRVVAQANRPPPADRIEAQATLRIVYDLPRPDLPVEGLTASLRFVERPRN